ncbi:hypothetical protein JCM31447_15210 [Fluviispira sanaruensis]|uniref:Uncharacterized protein n=1 Tax=Fluviispira sanaruensis TaxID=2493639 RepID=A0A4P2VKF5_FLUSA|nr:hypothetical protein JCM31447_15210 [Fluviispira sanaruensis]
MNLRMNETKINSILIYLNKYPVFYLNIPKRMRLRYLKVEFLVKNGEMLYTSYFLVKKWCMKLSEIRISSLVTGKFIWCLFGINNWYYIGKIRLSYYPLE